MEAPHTVSRRDWSLGEARCPTCGFHLNQFRDLDDYERTTSDTRATGALVTHRRCGAKFLIEFAEP